MQRGFFVAFFLCAAAATAPSLASRRAQQQPAPQQQPSAPPTAPAPAPAQAPPAQPAPQPPAKPTLSVVVLDPAHGGADAGARGPSGVNEADVVLGFANAIRSALEAQGYRVFQTRQGNEDPSFDDRAAVGNSHRGDVFISLHASSTGPFGTVRAYSLPPPAAELTPLSSPPPARPGLLNWDQAQQPYQALSRRLAEFTQVQLAQRFRGSPEAPSYAAVRQLRNVAAPAIAIEVSSVAVPDRSRLDQMAPTLAEAIARAVNDLRLIYDAGGQ